MDTIRSFQDVISLWPSSADFGRDIGVADVSARAMKRRNRIPSKYWNNVVTAAVKKGLSCITYEVLAKMAAKKTLSKKPIKSPNSN